MNRVQLGLCVALVAVGLALCASAWAMFPPSSSGAGPAVGFPDVCKVPQDAVEALPREKAPTDAQVGAVKAGLDKVMASVVFADEFLAKSNQPKAKIDEAKKVLDQVWQLVGRARSEIPQVPRGDQTGALHKRLLPIIKEMLAIPYPPLLRPEGK